MTFLRPEAVTALLRWRETLAGAALAVLGLYWFLTAFGLLRWLSVVVLASGLSMVWTGVQRARFRAGHGGLGVVQVDEREIAYFAPVGGGFASIDALTRVEIAPDRAGLPVWRFHSRGERLTIPINAEGTAALFDVLTALDGVDMTAAIRASQSHPDRPVTIWVRTAPRHLRLDRVDRP